MQQHTQTSLNLLFSQLRVKSLGLRYIERQRHNSFEIQKITFQLQIEYPLPSKCIYSLYIYPPIPFAFHLQAFFGKKPGKSELKVTE